MSVRSQVEKLQNSGLYATVLSLLLATIVSSCSSNFTTNTETPVVAADPSEELTAVVRDFMRTVESNDRAKSRSYILEPDKNYSTEILKELRSKNPADPPSNSSSNKTSRKGKNTGVGIPVRQDWFAVFRDEHYEFGQIVDQSKDGEHGEVVVQLKNSAVGLAQNFRFYLKNESGRWLIADVAWDGEPYLLNPPLPKKGRAQHV